MSERVDPWEGVPDSWREALRSYACAEATMPEWREARVRFAALLREAAADQARLDWLEENAQDTKGLNIGGVCYWGIWKGRKRLSDGNDLRDAIDAARGSVPSPTPTKKGAT